MRFQVGTDVGGTFTDLWVVADDGRSEVVKVASTKDVLGGVVAAVHEAAARFGTSTEDFCRAIDRFGHGTTAGLNALLTGDLSITGLVTTAGFGDTLEIGRMKRQVAGLSDLEIGDYLQRGRWKPVVPRHLVVEVPERVDRTGRVLRELDEEAARRAVDGLLKQGVRAIGVCTLWSIVEPRHELRIGELIEEMAPEIFVTLSHLVAPSTGEYARMSTTAVNAALGPVLATYFAELDSVLRELGLTVPATVMTSGGGVVRAEEVIRTPASAMMSGPAAGVTRSRALGQRLGYDHLLSIDVGGTSFDVGTISNGVPLMRSEMTIAGADLRYPAIDIATVGAGGGSIAEVTHGALRVGPSSAGSLPGPACYGRGGQLPTATDADLVLGVFAPDDLGGGALELDIDAARRAIHDHVAVPLGLDIRRAAWGIRQVLDSKMADLLRTVTIERGHDPREFVMIAIGGQGPAHAWALAADLGIRTVLVPPTATVQSAVGTATSELRRFHQQPVYRRLPPGRTPDAADVEALRTALDEGTAIVRSHLSGYGGGDLDLGASIAIRFRGQAHHLDVPTSVTLARPDEIAEALERFERDYEALFGQGSAFRAAGFELLSVRVTGTASLEPLAEPCPTDVIESAGEREVVFADPEKPAMTRIYRTQLPASGQRIEGPALIVFPGQTVVVPPDARAETDELGDIVVHLTDQREVRS